MAKFLVPYSASGPGQSAALLVCLLPGVRFIRRQNAHQAGHSSRGMAFGLLLLGFLGAILISGWTRTPSVIIQASVMMLCHCLLVLRHSRCNQPSRYASQGHEGEKRGVFAGIWADCTLGAGRSNALHRKWRRTGMMWLSVEALQEQIFGQGFEAIPHMDLDAVRSAAAMFIESPAFKAQVGFIASNVRVEVSNGEE